MTSIAIYGAIVATISFLVSGATFLRDRARVRFFAWLTDPQGTYRIWDTEMRTLLIRAINAGRRPIVLKAMGISFRPRRTRLFRPPPRWVLKEGEEVASYVEVNEQLEPLSELTVTVQLSELVADGYNVISSVWAKDSLERKHRMDQVSIWFLRRTVRTMAKERRKKQLRTGDRFVQEVAPRPPEPPDGSSSARTDGPSKTV